MARQVFDAAVKTELLEIMAEFKVRAGKAATPDDLWTIRDYLTARQREVDRKYDYRYSQLVHVFGQLVREKRVSMTQLAGLSEEKRTLIWHLATL